MTPLNEALLAEYASFEQPQDGFAERFVRFRVGSGQTVGVVTAPTGPSQDLGWISCHSYGMEHVDLMGLERTVARRLAGAGYPTLRFHCQGYGDSQSPPGTATLSTQVRDTQDAAAWARDHLGTSRLGLLGWKFGTLVATEALESVKPSHLVLAAPPVNGARYMSELLRSFAFKDWGNGDAGANAGELRAKLEAEGELDLGGMRLSQVAFREASAASLAALDAFRGTCLILQVSTSARPTRSLRELTDRVNAAGGTASLVVLEHQFAALLGRPRLRLGQFRQLADVLAGLDLTMAETMLGWLDGLQEPAVLDPSEVAG